MSTVLLPFTLPASMHIDEVKLLLTLKNTDKAKGKAAHAACKFEIGLGG